MAVLAGALVFWSACESTTALGVLHGGLHDDVIIPI